MTEHYYYSYAEYRFDFAVWAAFKGITAGSAPKGFTIEKARCILKATGFYGLAENGVEWLPDPKYFDKRHYTWCEEVCEKRKHLEIKDWSDGRSAKLINVFIKTLMPLTLPNRGKAKWYAVHPPIDGEVLKGMKNAGIGNNNIWDWLKAETGSSLPYGSWTNFKYEHYEKVIDMIRCNLRECGEKEDLLPLWKNERFFKP